MKSNSFRKFYSSTIGVCLFASFGLLILLFGMAGCKPEGDVLTPIEIRESGTDTLVEYEYRVDNSIVTAYTPSIASDSTSIFLFETGAFSSIAYHTKTIVHKFTSKSEYYEYAEGIEFPAELYDILSDSLAKLAIKFKMDSIVAADNEIPEWWSDLEDDVYEGVFSGIQDNTVRPRSLITQLNDDWRNICRGLHGDGNNQIFTLPGIGMPVLGLLGWRNRVSGMTPLFIGGANFIYQRSFYRRRLGTVIGWALTTTDFCGPLAGLNNASNSWWNVGL